MQEVPVHRKKKQEAAMEKPQIRIYTGRISVWTQELLEEGRRRESACGTFRDRQRRSFKRSEDLFPGA